MIDITERLRKLSIAVSEQNWQEFSMRVPAEPDRDADIVIMQAAMLIESLRQQLSSRDAEVAELQKAIDENWVTHQQIVTASKERDQLRKQVMMLRGLLLRYRTETPPAHSPPMICHFVDKALAATEPKS